MQSVEKKAQHAAGKGHCFDQRRHPAPRPRALHALSFVVLLVSLQSKSAEGVANGTHFDRFVVVMLENADYEVALANDYLASLAARPDARLLSDYHGLAHPSQVKRTSKHDGEAALLFRADGRYGHLKGKERKDTREENFKLMCTAL